MSSGTCSGACRPSLAGATGFSLFSPSPSLDSAFSPSCSPSFFSVGSASSTGLSGSGFGVVVPLPAGVSSSPTTNSGSNSAGSGAFPLGNEPSLLLPDLLGVVLACEPERLTLESARFGDWPATALCLACSSAMRLSIAPFRRCVWVSYVELVGRQLAYLEHCAVLLRVGWCRVWSRSANSPKCMRGLTAAVSVTFGGSCAERLPSSDRHSPIPGCREIGLPRPSPLVWTSSNLNLLRRLFLS